MSIALHSAARRTAPLLLLCLLLAACASPARPGGGEGGGGSAPAQPVATEGAAAEEGEAGLPADLAVARLPAPDPTPGASLGAACGEYTVTQNVTEVHGVGRVTEIVIADASGGVTRRAGLEGEGGGMAGFDRVLCGDMTGDGAPELIVEQYTGGANCCFLYDLYSMTPGLPSLWHWEAGGGGVQEVVALRGEPPYEILGARDLFLPLTDYLPHYALPTLPVVFALREGQYVAATGEYPDVLRADQEDALAALPACNGELLCEQSQALRAFAEGVLLGEEEQALADITALAQPTVVEWLDSVRPRVLELLGE